MGQTLIPNLVFQSPGILNTPQKDEMTYMASIWDSIDNWWIEHAEVADISKQVVLSSYLFNTTATQIGYDFGTEADELRTDQQEVFGDVENVVDRSRSQNAPWVDFIPPHRFVVAVGTKTMRNCYWGAKLVSVPTSILKKQKGLKNVSPSKLPEDVLKMEHATWEDKDVDKWTHFWEIWLETIATFWTWAQARTSPGKCSTGRGARPGWAQAGALDLSPRTRPGQAQAGKQPSYQMWDAALLHDALTKSDSTHIISKLVTLMEISSPCWRDFVSPLFLQSM